MKIRGSFKIFIALMAIAAFILFSCKKELSSTDELRANYVASEADAEAEGVYNGLFDDIMGLNNVRNEIGIPGTGIFGLNSVVALPGDNSTARTDSLPSCATTTILQLNAPAIFPVKYIIEFSASGCLCNDGHVRKGKIITVFTNRLSLHGASATTVFENFWIDSIHVEGNHVITNTTALNNPLQYTIDVDAKLTKTNGNFTEWHRHYVMTQFDGTILPSNQGFKIWPGNATGKVKRNDVLTSWRAEVIEPLVKRYSCHWISKGIVKTTRDNLATNSPWIGYLNYGNGNCDDRATLTVNGNVHEITLR